MSIRTSDSRTTGLKQTLQHRKLNPDDHQHPVNVLHHDEASFGEMLADKISAGIGSWTFLIIQSFLVALWLMLNIVGFMSHWDPFPFILLNLLFSVQAAYTGPVLLLAGNRQSQKDRLTLEHAAYEADKADEQNVEILRAIEHDTEVTLQILKQVESMVSEHVEQGRARVASRGPEPT